MRKLRLFTNKSRSPEPRRKAQSINRVSGLLSAVQLKSNSGFRKVNRKGTRNLKLDNEFILLCWFPQSESD